MGRITLVLSSPRLMSDEAWEILRRTIRDELEAMGMKHMTIELKKEKSK
jgi:hypothetical protein